MRGIFHINPALRAVGVIGVVTALATGVTFAALTNTTSADDNTITTGSAALRIDTNADAVFHVSENGFDFTGIVPGTPSTDLHTFTLKNLNTSGSVVVNAQIPTPPALPSGVTGADVTFTFTPTVPGGSVVTATWAELTAGDGKQVLAAFPGASTQTFTVKVDIADTVTASSVSIPNFKLVFGVPS